MAEEKTCPVHEEPGKPCGKPAKVYPFGPPAMGATHTACLEHRFEFLYLLGGVILPLMEAQALERRRS